MNQRTLQSDPAAFREAILIDADSGPIRRGDVLNDCQANDFAALHGPITEQSVAPRDEALVIAFVFVALL